MLERASVAELTLGAGGPVAWVRTEPTLDELLARPTVREQKERAQQGELVDILMSKTAKERSILEKVSPRTGHGKDMAAVDARASER